MIEASVSVWVYFRVLVQDAKILIMSHNLPSRLFQQWHYKVLSMTQMHLDYDTLKESVETIISECLTAILKLGQHLLKYPKVGHWYGFWGDNALQTLLLL